MILGTIQAQKVKEQVQFRFVVGNDMFFSPWSGNGENLERLTRFVDEHKDAITSGATTIDINGYCASSGANATRLLRAKIMSNRVKSELILRCGVSERNFKTKNSAIACDDQLNAVVVNIVIPAPKHLEQQPVPETETVVEEIRREEPLVVEPNPESKSETLPEIAERPKKGYYSYLFALRTNLLYDALLLPTIGLEWRINPSLGIKVDGSRSWWSNEDNQVQKIWLLSPEVRWYMLNKKRFYLGASANFGEYNIYKNAIGSLFSDDTGYQGKLWGAGITLGYQVYLSRCLSFDFNLGLGYTKFQYDSFNVINQTRVCEEPNLSKNFFGPTQAGFSLVWTIGGIK